MRYFIVLELFDDDFITPSTYEDGRTKKFTSYEDAQKEASNMQDPYIVEIER